MDLPKKTQGRNLARSLPLIVSDLDVFYIALMTMGRKTE